jgi:hypothetical protein
MALLVFCKRLNTTGTVTVCISEAGVSKKAVTVNASDLPADLSWVFFKFTATYTSTGLSTVSIGVKGSSAANAEFHRNGTAGNWSRIIRRTTTGSIAAADTPYIIGDLTGAGTSATSTVTQDGTASTAWGEINIGNIGSLVSGTTASTNYLLQMAGDVVTWLAER